MSKVASALMVGLLDEVMRYEIIPELLMELDWEGNTADNGFGYENEMVHICLSRVTHVTT